MSDYNINGLAIPLFIVFMAIEYLFLRVKGKSLHRYNDSIASLSMGLCLLISDALLKVYTFAVFIYLFESYRIFEFSSENPLTWLLFFFGVDLCYYAFHRMAHEINLLWGAHVGHHQSEEYNLTTALRQSAFQYGFSWLFYLPLAILGCPPLVFLLLFIFLKIYQFWLHTQAIQRIPMLEGIFSTPSSHRVHHAKNPIYIDRNYGGTLVIWDRMFSTWQAELVNEPCHYGTTTALNTLNPVKANFQHWAMLLKDTIKTRQWRNKIGLWFKSTGWRPEDCRTQNPTTSKLQKRGTNGRKKYDPQASMALKIYSGFSFICILLVAVMFIFLTPTLAAITLTVGTVTIVYGLVVINDLMEGSKRLLWLEVIRLPVMLWLAHTLWLSSSTSHIVDTIVIEKTPAQVLSYASSPALWSSWHSKSSIVHVDSAFALHAGEKFDEDIQTILGQNHLTWRVIISNNERWVALGENQTNGASIKLQYRVSALAEKTVFERTLDYMLPNVALVAINALYFKSKIEEDSEAALDRLRIAIVNTPGK